MGELVPFGKIWRTGLNNFAVKLEGNAVAKGKYKLYTISGRDMWVITINKAINRGTYNYMELDDLVRFKLNLIRAKQFVETFTISIEGT